MLIKIKGGTWLIRDTLPLPLISCWFLTMHFFRTHIGTIGILKQRKDVIHNQYMLVWVFLLFIGYSRLVTVESALVLPPATPAIELHRNLVGNSLFITEPQPPRVSLYFENTPEPEFESTGEDTEHVEETRVGIHLALSLQLLATVAQHRTNSTLAHCEASLYRRIRLPLFVLFHTWKNFLA